MRPRRVPVLFCALLSGLLAGIVTPSTASAATASLSYDVVSPQQVSLDPSGTGVAVTYRLDACPNGCQLVRVGYVRANYEEVVLDTRQFPAGATRSFRVTDTIDARPGLGWTHHYELRVFSDAARTAYDVALMKEISPSFASEGIFRFGANWRREVSLSSTETMTMRSATPGATATLPATGERRRIGLVSARGPRNGVLRVTVGGAARTVDLAAPAWQPRQVVAALDVPANTAVTLVNATPAARAAKDVYVDGLIGLLDMPSYPAQRMSTGRAPSQRALTAPRALAAPSETIEARVAPAGQLASSAGTAPTAVTARVLGCPAGCSIVRGVYTDTGLRETVVLRRTSPASGALQALTVTDPLPAGRLAYYHLRKGSTTVDRTPTLTPTVLPETAAVYSYGWTRDTNATTVGGRIMRSSTPGTGATYRVPGTFEGRSVGVVAARGPHNGVLGVHVNGHLVREVDLRAASWQPRQIVASVDLPLSGRVTLTNRSATTRTGKDIHVDGLVLLDRPDDFY